MFYVVSLLDLDLIKSKVLKILLLFSTALFVLNLSTSKVLAVEISGQVRNEVGDTIANDDINFADDATNLINSGVIHGSAEGDAATIDMGTNPASSINQVSGTLNADVIFNSNGQQFIYDGGTVNGNFVGSSGSDFNGDLIINSDLDLPNSQILGVKNINLREGVVLNFESPISNSRNLRFENLELARDSEFRVARYNTIFANSINGTASGSGKISSSDGYLSFFNSNVGAQYALESIDLDQSSLISIYDDVEFNVNRLLVNSSMAYISSNANISDMVTLSGNSSRIFNLAGLRYGRGGELGYAPNVDLSYNVVNQGESSRFYYYNFYSDDLTVNFDGKSIANEENPLKEFFLYNSSADLSEVAGLYAQEFIIHKGEADHDIRVLLGVGEVKTRFIKNYQYSHAANIEIVADHQLRSEIAATDQGRLGALKIHDDVSLDVRNDIAIDNIINGQNSVFKVHADVDNGLLYRIEANNFQNNGIIDLSAASGIINTEIVNNDGSVLIIGNSNVNIDNRVDFASGSVLSVAVNSDNDFGSLTSPVVNISDDVVLNIQIRNAHDLYKMESAQLQIVESQDKERSEIAEINDDKIAINSKLGNRIGYVRFSTNVEDKNLLLNIKKSPLAGLPGHDSGVIGVIDDIGDKSSGELLALQNYLYLKPGVSDADRSNAIKSLKPSNEGISQLQIHHSDSVFRSIESRISSSRIAKIIAGQKSYRTVDADGNDVEELDKSSTAQVQTFATDANIDRNDRDLWLQLISSDAKQKQQDGFEGFNADSQALILGYDKKINQSTLLGVSLSFADSKITSIDNLRTTTSDMTQLSLYGEKEIYKDIYLDSMISVSHASHDSSRNIPAISRSANASFDSRNYAAKIGIHKSYILDNGFDLTPNFDLKYSNNQVENYTESGAGALNLSVITSDLERLEGSLSLAAGYRSDVSQINLGFTKVDPFTIYPNLKIAYDYDFIGDSQTSLSNFSGHDLSFATRSSSVDRSTVKITAGVETYRTEDLKLNLKYIQERRDSYISHSGLLETKIAF